MFNGWIPHRSSANNSAFSRRAVFLTYNDSADGDLRDDYYDRMKSMRENYRNKAANNCKNAAAGAAGEEDEQSWLESVPK